MGSFRFLFSRRWAFFAIAVVVLVAAAWWLGNWQFDRLDDRRAENGIVSANEDADPVPVETVLAPDKSVSEHDEWRRIEATGTYDVDNTIVWRYRTDGDGASGINVVVPLKTDTGATLLVDRGWMPVEEQTDYSGIPAPPSGTVTLTAWVRADGTGSSTSVDEVDGYWGTRALSSRTVGPAIGQDVYQGFVQVESEDPAPETALTRAELPELGDGPHLFYGIQWWFFGALAVFGFFYLLYDERRSQRRKSDDGSTETPVDQRSERRRKREQKNARKQAVREAYRKAYEEEASQSERIAPPSTGSMTPETYDDAGDNTNAATRPNSSGRP